MINSMRSIFRLLFGQTTAYRRWRHRRLFPRLAVADSANLDVTGRFTYGAEAQIGPYSNVIVAPGGALEIGDGVFIGRGVETGTSSRICIGDGTSIQDGSVILGTVDIGRYCIIAYRLYASSGRHYFDLKPEWLVKDQDEYVRNTPELAALHDRAVVIEDDCWIGANVVVMRGVTVGKGSVIGANSVVTGDVPPYSVAAGAPARVVKRRLEFAPPQQIDAREAMHLPYFYLGFNVQQRDLKETAQSGGITTGGCFTLALAASGKKRVVLNARSLIDKPVRIRHGDQISEVNVSATEVRFNLAIEPGERLRFEVLTETGARNALSIASARVES